MAVQYPSRSNAVYNDPSFVFFNPMTGVQLSAQTAAPQQGLTQEGIDEVIRGLPISQQEYVS